MELKHQRALACLGVVAAAMTLAMPLIAQTEVKEKPPMYTYVADWAIPRAQWGELEKTAAADRANMDKAVASGTLIGYGSDHVLVHKEDGITHDDWWQSKSMAGLMSVLDQLAGSSTNSVLASATKHSDMILMSRYYNYRPGSWKGVYGHGSSYTLKPDAPDEAVDMLSKTLFVPFFEKLMSDGTIYEYEVDTQAVHTENPNTFYVYYLCANAECLDKVDAALQNWQKTNPLGGPAFGSMIDFKHHRDDLVRGDASYK